MDKRTMDAMIKEELKYIPKSRPGFKQNISRVAYSSNRQHHLTKGIDDRVQSLLIAARECRKDDPDFTPTFDEAYFRVTLKELLQRLE
ncbi:MAG: hypothetical protein OEY99_03335 [Aigarchaeota archaeon]|nr:hypothetical protein [Aigarchaeota archaeon]